MKTVIHDSWILIGIELFHENLLLEPGKPYYIPSFTGATELIPNYGFHILKDLMICEATFSSRRVS